MLKKIINTGIYINYFLLLRLISHRCLKQAIESLTTRNYLNNSNTTANSSNTTVYPNYSNNTTSYSNTTYNPYYNNTYTDEWDEDAIERVLELSKEDIVENDEF